ncbi:hypothetical protein NY406_07570 [Chlorobaculum sp. MV4-Y]|uniref:hypothetical protein n=1 Tax=Chlorobaculum sp. MV4-Y TaxID=2976335 RepID=UPI0021AF8420|nr:hypothetical protein [Chlorobaculum sp. MV4-Y]UWX57078.1 hypothetical protein NY406_07570 [Chlorobaculum sp. MV4-Y]
MKSTKIEGELKINVKRVQCCYHLMFPMAFIGQKRYFVLDWWSVLHTMPWNPDDAPKLFGETCGCAGQKPSWQSAT